MSRYITKERERREDIVCGLTTQKRKKLSTKQGVALLISYCAFF